jgi:oxidoreductase
MFKAIIIGATGATGRQLLKKLLDNNKCDQIITIGRKSSLNNQRHSKLKDIILPDLKNLSSTKQLWSGNDVFFNCIGTTRKIAGSAKEFFNVEVGISSEAAKMAFKARIPHVSLISAAGVDANIWAKEWIHPLFYMKTMGKKENTILKDYTFQNITIFKPGMLLRLQKKQSWIENFLESIGSGLRVDLLADAMMLNAEKLKLDSNQKSINFFKGNKEIKEYLDNI